MEDGVGDRIKRKTSGKRKRRRHRWPIELKARIVGESIEGGVTVADVARKHGVAPNQLSEWRRLALRGTSECPELESIGFVPLAVQEPKPPALMTPNSPSHPTIEIAKGAVTIRLLLETPSARVAEIATAL